MSENRQAASEAIRKEPDKLKAEKQAPEKERKELERERDEALARAGAAEDAVREKSAGLDAQAAKQEEMIIRQIASQRKVRIVIPSGRDPHERCPVPVGLNGREFLIERDREADVPEGVLNVLELAVANVARTVDEGNFANTTFHRAPRYPLRVIGYLNDRGELERA